RCCRQPSGCVIGSNPCGGIFCDRRHLRSSRDQVRPQTGGRAMSTDKNDEQELEAIIADLIRRKYAAPEGSPERQLVLRELAGLRSSWELAGPIMEELDPKEWGVTDRLPAVAEPEGQVI